LIKYLKRSGKKFLLKLFIKL